MASTMKANNQQTFWLKVSTCVTLYDNIGAKELSTLQQIGPNKNRRPILNQANKPKVVFIVIN